MSNTGYIKFNTKDITTVIQVKQLAQALKSAGEEQTKLWTVPYSN